MNLIIRSAEEQDLLSVIQMLAEDQLGASRETVGTTPDPQYLAAYRSIKSDRNNELVVAEKDGEILGTMQLTFIPGLSRLGAWRCQIEAVRVREDKRGHGIGHKMITWGIAQARMKECRLVQLTTDKSRENAHIFYGRLGFKPSHIGMKLSLDS